MPRHGRTVEATLWVRGDHDVRCSRGGGSVNISHGLREGSGCIQSHGKSTTIIVYSSFMIDGGFS